MQLVTIKTALGDMEVTTTDDDVLGEGAKAFVDGLIARQQIAIGRDVELERGQTHRLVEIGGVKKLLCERRF